MPDLIFDRSFATIFSHSFLEKIILGTHVNHLSDLITKSEPLRKAKATLTLNQLFAAVYHHFKKHYRCEYLYKNTIANELLKGKHSLDAGLFTEFKSGNGWTDVVIVNGTTSSYEIKTELDSLYRLGTQVLTNEKIFDQNYVVTYEKILGKVEKIVGTNVGILVLNEKSKIVTYRDATSTRDSLEPLLVFNSLRRAEYLDILRMEIGFEDNLPNTQIYSICRDIFVTLRPEIVHRHFTRVLKNRACVEQIRKNVARAPLHLRSLFLSYLYREAKFQQIMRSLESCIC